MTQKLCSNPGCELPAVIKFCSSSCAAKYNNSVSPKRKLVNTCKSCGTKIRTSVRYCKTCKNNKFESMTIGEHRKKSPRIAQSYNALRSATRTRYKNSGLPYECAVCGYSKHVELAHRISLSELPDNTLISEAISPTSVIPLCPNHHWEFDYNGLVV